MPDKNENTKPFETVKKVLKYLIPKAWKFRKGYFFLAAASMLIGAASPFVMIFMTPLIIDELMGNRDAALLAEYAATAVLGQAALGLADSVISITIEKYNEKYSNFFTEELSRRAMELDFQLTEDKKALEQLEKAREGMNWYSGGVIGITFYLFHMISAIILIAGTVAVIAANAPVMFAVSAVILIFQTFVNNKINKIEVETYGNLAKENRILNYLGWEVTDFRYGKDIRLYGAADMMTEKWRFFCGRLLGSDKRQADRQLPLSIAVSVSGTAEDFIKYIYLGALVIIGKITVGTFSQMLTASAHFQAAALILITSVQEIVKRCNYAYEYVKFMDYPAAIEKGTRHIEGKEHTIEFRNVTFTYPNTDVKVLDGVNITIRQGEHLSVVGLNGAGKTTFIKLMCRLYDPTGGEILLDGVNIKEYDYEEYMSLFSPVFQDFKLFGFTLRENISLDGKCDDKELEALIEQVGLAEKISSLENKADTVLFKAFDENGIEPSGGEQQKIAIARALYKKSPVVILDEPTAALDPIAEYNIYRQFSTLVGGKTAIYISHRLSSCRFCDRIAVFSEGMIKEYGTHDELSAKENGIYAGMYAAQAKYYR